MSAGIDITLYMGQHGEKQWRYALPLDESFIRDLQEPMELSDDPISLLLAGGWRAKSTVELRQRAFKMRRDHAEAISRALVAALMEAFGEHDVTDGYSHEQMRRIKAREIR